MPEPSGIRPFVLETPQLLNVYRMVTVDSTETWDEDTRRTIRTVRLCVGGRSTYLTPDETARLIVALREHAGDLDPEVLAGMAVGRATANLQAENQRLRIRVNGLRCALSDILARLTDVTASIEHELRNTAPPHTA